MVRTSVEPWSHPDFMKEYPELEEPDGVARVVDAALARIGSAVRATPEATHMYFAEINAVDRKMPIALGCRVPLFHISFFVDGLTYGSGRVRSVDEMAGAIELFCHSPAPATNLAAVPWIAVREDAFLHERSPAEYVDAIRRRHAANPRNRELAPLLEVVGKRSELRAMNPLLFSDVLGFSRSLGPGAMLESPWARALGMGRYRVGLGSPDAGETLGEGTAEDAADLIIRFLPEAMKRGPNAWFIQVIT